MGTEAASARIASVAAGSASLNLFSRYRRTASAPAGPLLLPADAIGRIGSRRLHDQALYQLCKRPVLRAKIEPFSPHDLRRTFAGDMLDAGADLALVQQPMGHSSPSPSTTAGYDRRPEAARIRAAELVDVPY